MKSQVSLLWGRGRFDTHRIAEGNVVTEAEMGEMRPQAKESWQPPEAGRGKEQILPQGFCREDGTADSLIPTQ